MTDALVRPGAGYRDYAVFGLRVRSNVELPELFPAPGTAAPDVTIELGPIPVVAQGERDGLNHVNGGLVLVIPDIGRYKIEAGSRITVDSEPGVPERNLRLFLLGSAFGALLHQRGLLPLHSNAVELGGRAVAFMGESGAGKSTLAAWFHDRGYRIVADDVCVVRFLDDGRPVTLPGLPRLRLWQESLEAMGREAHHFQRSYVGEDGWNKFDIPITQQTAALTELELSAIYVLEKGDAFEIRGLNGIAAAEAIFAHTYRGAYVSAVKGEHDHWAACTRLVQNTPVYRLRRPWGLNRMNEHGQQLLDHAMATAGSDSAR